MFGNILYRQRRSYLQCWMESEELWVLCGLWLHAFKGYPLQSEMWACVWVRHWATELHLL